MFVSFFLDSSIPLFLSFWPLCSCGSCLGVTQIWVFRKLPGKSWLGQVSSSFCFRVRGYQWGYVGLGEIAGATYYSSDLTLDLQLDFCLALYLLSPYMGFFMAL